MTVDHEPTYRSVSLDELAELRPAFVRRLEDGSYELCVRGEWRPVSADSYFVVPMSEWLTRTT